MRVTSDSGRCEEHTSQTKVRSADALGVDSLEGRCEEHREGAPTTTQYVDPALNVTPFYGEPGRRQEQEVARANTHLRMPWEWSRKVEAESEEV